MLHVHQLLFNLVDFTNYFISREIHYKQAHPNEPMYPCGECGAKFNTKSARWSHSFSHKADDTFKCEHCEKTFNVRNLLRDHTKKFNSFYLIRTILSPIVDAKLPQERPFKASGSSTKMLF